MKKHSILLVDDDLNLLDSLADWLESKGYGITAAGDCPQALKWLDERSFDCVLTDIHLGDGDGFDVLKRCQRDPEGPAVILMTGYGTVETAVEALRAGAFDLLTKPLIDEELELSLNRALNQRSVLEENRRLKRQLDNRFGLESVVGRDPRMSRIFDLIERIAETKATVLITGESGTGKSLVARAIHRRSARRDGAFVEIACGALPESLLESELFGHVAGAYTGAVGERIGKFQQSEGGTIFLDEIGTASPGLQVKLLRVLQEFAFEPVGGTKTIRVDTRVILATNEDLSRAVSEGRFRQDLYYRVNVINLEIPPLRERISDIPLLAAHFLRSVGEESGKAVTGFNSEALAALERYHWPGNVRELQNVVERAVLLSRSELLGLDDLPPSIVSGTPALAAAAVDNGSLKRALQAPERQIILEVLEAHGWNRNATADFLGINRTTLYKKMKRLGLDRPEVPLGRPFPPPRPR
ncbi:MAG: sigma-54 dependent transcriptional regulator [Pirellulales bacterium]